MFLPYLPTASFWLSQSALYGWEPEAPAIDATRSAGEVDLAVPSPAAEPDAAASCTPQGLPAMRLVFRGVKWTACSAFGMRENVAWDSVSQTQRDADEAQRDAKRRASCKARPNPDGVG